MQSVPITTNVVSSNPGDGEEYSIHHHVEKVCQWLATGQVISLGTPGFLTNINDRHDITAISWKITLNTITLTLIPVI